ncbi:MULTISPECIES: hypothetical protein [Mycobacterium]|uniref:hypothetical protein n=1 Tax=Mycobacterium TaxID=1763 RepID=UPI00096816A6|nr:MULTISPECIES: hypothetical protein [Mycobacterium]MCG7609687.1 hypothetical protein [Mycobacterium sp. CnD-18-1]OLT91270.1 hypothetical protein BKG60_23060 [Mycobacterium syngnathidarum]
MFETYFANDGAADAAEFNRTRELIDQMLDALAGIENPAPRSLIAGLDARATLPMLPSAILRSYLNHSLFNLKHVTETVTPGRTVSVPVVMSALRVSLLASSRLSYVVAAPDAAVGSERMDTILALEARSVKQYIRKFQAQSELPGMHPAPGTSVTVFASMPFPRVEMTEGRLLGNLKAETLAEIVAQTGHPVGVIDVLTDHLFQTTSGAAHGYMWVDLEGVVAHFVPQLGWTATIANIVLTKFMKAMS